MALPKRHHSRARTRSRRAHWKLSAPTLVTCANVRCGKPTRPHTACRYCGYYNGEEIFKVEAKKE